MFILTITVILYGIFNSKKEIVKLRLEPGSTVETVSEEIGLDPWLLFVLNESVVNNERQLNNGDVLEVFPPLSGG